MTDTVERIQQDIAHLEGENETLAAALVDARIHAEAAREEIAGLREQLAEAQRDTERLVELLDECHGSSSFGAEGDWEAGIIRVRDKILAARAPKGRAGDELQS